jgi:hypothetical protein
VRILLAAVCCGLALPGLAAAAPPSLSGAVAYTDVLRFDYDQDGVTSQVQFWLEFKGTPAGASPAAADGPPPGGEVRYYLVDLDKKVSVPKWHQGFSMAAEPAPSGPYPMKGLAIEGATARFEAFGMKWTVVDGGQGYAQDWVTVDDGFKPSVMKLYGGDLQVESVEQPLTAQDKLCIRCHDEPAELMSRSGGRHAALGCTKCHVGHPPTANEQTLACTKCHESHAADMAEGSCGGCHRAHETTAVSYAYDVPSRYCGACHPEVAGELGSGRSKHAHLGCALCHPGTHTATADCRHCHGAPHPSHVMRNTGVCGSCHNTAHKLNSARAR